MTTWAALLDDYEAAIAASASLVTQPDAPAVPAPFEPPSGDDLPVPTPAEVRRYTRLQARAERLRGELDDALTAIAGELDAGRDRRRAVRAYVG